MQDSAAILDDITSRDPQRVIPAMWAIFRLRDATGLDVLAAALPEIEAATAGLELGGIIHSNDETLGFVLAKLRFHRDRAGCLCELYPDHPFYDPEREAEAGYVRILETLYVGRWPDTYRCECAECGARFDVEHGEQHAEWWKWTKADA